jgi:CBS domain-containing protein
MTTAVRSVLATADVAKLALAFLDEGRRSVPVLEDERLVGIVSRRDALRALARSDDEIGRTSASSSTPTPAALIHGR